MTIEGLTLWRRSPRINFAVLISVEHAPLHLLNCRILRSAHQGQDILVWGQLRAQALDEPQARQRFRALLGFQHGSSGVLRNCVVAGTRTSAFELRSSTNEPTRVETENSVLVTDATFYMKLEPETKVHLRSASSVFVTAALLDLNETAPVNGITAIWENCLVDRSKGALLRANDPYDGALLESLDWRQTNMVTTGQGTYVATRRRRTLASALRWNEMMRLDPNNHRVTDVRPFPDTCVRSGLTLQAADLDPRLFRTTGFEPDVVGEGKPYERFRSTSDYRAWQRDAHAARNIWEVQRDTKP